MRTIPLLALSFLLACPASQPDDTAADTDADTDADADADADVDADSDADTGDTGGVDPSDVDDDADGFTENDGDCDDSDAAVYPGAVDVWYDDVDADCDGADDFDADGDGYIPAAFEGVYTGSLPSGDCDDSNADIHPGATEIPYNGVDEDCEASTRDDDVDGDGADLATDCDDNDPARAPGLGEVDDNFVDEDCDGAVGVSTWLFDGRHWRFPRRPALAGNDLGVGLAIASDTNPSQLLLLDTSGSVTDEVSWHGTVFTEVIHFGLDMLGEGNAFYIASSTVAGGDTYLLVRELTFDGTWDQGVASRLNGGIQLYTHADLLRADDGRLYGIGCGPDSFMYLELSGTGITFQSENDGVGSNFNSVTAGQRCLLHDDGTEVYVNVWSDTHGAESWRIDGGFDFTATGAAFEATAVDVGSSGDWLAMAGGSAYDGVRIHRDDGSMAATLFAGAAVQSVSVQDRGSELIVAALADDADGDGQPDIWVATGSPNDPAEWRVGNYAHGSVDQDPEHIGVWADDDHVWLAVSSQSVADDDNDAVGWVVLAR